jgi:hypothetical protein
MLKTLVTEVDESETPILILDPGPARARESLGIVAVSM